MSVEKSELPIGCAEQRVGREGLSPSDARMGGVISKSGSNDSLADEGWASSEGRVSIARWNPKGMRRSIGP